MSAEAQKLYENRKAIHDLLGEEGRKQLEAFLDYVMNNAPTMKDIDGEDMLCEGDGSFIDDIVAEGCDLVMEILAPDIILDK